MKLFFQELEFCQIAEENFGKYENAGIFEESLWNICWHVVRSGISSIGYYEISKKKEVNGSID